MKRFFLACLASLSATIASAQSYNLDDVVAATIRPGWRVSEGEHMAGLELKLAPGWKTYWRAPGDAGIPPQFQWRGAGNTAGVAVHWPVPEVFHQSGMRSVGYDADVVLPLRVVVRQPGKDARLRGVIDIGICKEVCIPHRLRVDAVLPASPVKADPYIVAALADQPYSAAEAGIGRVRCQVAPIDGGLSLRTEVDMPRKRSMETVIEVANPEVWVAEPNRQWRGNTLISDTRLLHVDGRSFALDRSGVRITLLGRDIAVDIKGCTG